jgi:hypothetical protein
MRQVGGKGMKGQSDRAEAKKKQLKEPAWSHNKNVFDSTRGQDSVFLR